MLLEHSPRRFRVVRLIGWNSTIFNILQFIIKNGADDLERETQAAAFAFAEHELPKGDRDAADGEDGISAANMKLIDEQVTTRGAVVCVKHEHVPIATVMAKLLVLLTQGGNRPA